MMIWYSIDVYLPDDNEAKMTYYVSDSTSYLNRPMSSTFYPLGTDP